MSSHPLFRASDILDMAVQIERQGADFYKTCLKADVNSHVRKVLQFLIDQEERHIQVFRDLKEGLDQTVLPESYEGETQEYIRSFVKDKVFHPPEKAPEEVDGVGNISQAVKWAITYEQHTIDFYATLKQSVRKSEAAVMDRIISEEKNHIRRLQELLER